MLTRAAHGGHTVRLLVTGGTKGGPSASAPHSLTFHLFFFIPLISPLECCHSKEKFFLVLQPSLGRIF